MKSKNSRVVSIAAAMLLAAVGGFLLWQNSGESESEATEEPAPMVQVLVAAKDIPRGESAEQMAENAYAYVKPEQISPDRLEADAITSLEGLDALALAGTVTGTNIASGAQLTGSDFVVPGQQDVSALPNVDPDLFEVTLAIEPQRAMGGTVRVGQRVAVIGSFNPGDDQPHQTVVIAERVLVTNVQTEQLLTEAHLDNDPLAPSLAPSSRLFVTFGVEVGDLEKLAYASEFGRIWLARQGETATIDGTTIRERSNVVVTIGGTNPISPDDGG